LELNNRGGYLDKKFDNYWWAADTKQMRVLRAYVLVGAVTRLAQTKHDSERKSLSKQVGVAVQVASDAFNCAYMQPGRCVFFDERMVELEVAVLRLLTAVLSTRDEEELLKGLQKLLNTTIPLLKGVESLSKLVDAATSTGELATNLSKIVSAVFTVGQNAYFTSRRVGAIYRDSIELQMITALKSLDTICAIQQQRAIAYSSRSKAYQKIALPLDPPERAHRAPPTQWSLSSNSDVADRLSTLISFYGLPEEMPSADACKVFRRGHEIWRRGAGDLSAWSGYLGTDVTPFVKWLVPSEDSFIQASDLIWRSCEHLTSKESERSQCIGRQEESRDREECAIDFNEQPKKAGDMEQLKKDGARLGKWCRLILYPKVYELRGERKLQQGANTRAYWLSDFTPSPFHPLPYHPGQLSETPRQR
jgi:hypothetical protein